MKECEAGSVKEKSNDLTTLSSTCFDEFFALSPDILCTVDVEGNFLSINPAAEAILGYPPEEMIGYNIFQFVLPEDRERTEAELADIVDGKVVEHFQNRYRTGDGQVCWLSWTGVARLKQGILYGVARDITQEKRATEAFQKQQQELAHYSRLTACGEMATGFAHELNQPLTAIAQYAGGCLLRLQEGGGAIRSEELVETVEKIVEQAERAGKLLHRLKDFITRGVGETTYIDFSEVVRAVLVLFQPTLDEVGVTMKLELSQDLPKFLGDRIQLEQVFTNLIKNAVDALSVNGEGEKEIIIRTCRTDEKIQVEVEDNGPGIDAEILPKIFDTFFTTKATGMGIGLSITRSLVEANGGVIAAMEGAAGARFSLRFDCKI